MKELCDLGINSTTRQIVKFKKVSKHKAIKRIKIKIQRNKEGYWIIENLLNKTQVVGLFSRFLKESKVKTM